MDSTLAMARTLLKIFSRDRQAIFFTLFFPITFMAIFGFINTGAEDPIEIGIVDKAMNDLSAAFIDNLSQSELFNVTVDTEESLRQQVIDGDIALTLIVPVDFSSSTSQADLTMLVDAAQARQIGRAHV